METEPNYSFVAARLCCKIFMMKPASAECPMNARIPADRIGTRTCFKAFIAEGIKHELVHPNLQEFDLDRLSKALDIERDQNFNYLGLQTLYDRYFIHRQGRRIELPQVFFMRVAMGLAHCEGNNAMKGPLSFIICYLLLIL